MMNKPKIFISYSHLDKEYKDRLDAHLTPLQIGEVADVWYDGLIKPGDEWEKQIDDEINQADIILLLISVHFINSKYCYSTELKKAIERHANGSARVIPIILSHCYWENQPFSKFQALPSQARPISGFGDKDEAYSQIVNEIHAAIKSAKLPIRDNALIERRNNEEVAWLREKELANTSLSAIMPWREYWNQVNKIAEIFAYCDYKPDFIFGISNGGLAAADFISRISFPNLPVFALWADRLKLPTDYYSDPFNLPLIDLIKHDIKEPEILLVDDNISSGQTFRQTIIFLKDRIPGCRIAYVPLFTRNKKFMNIQFMDKCIIWNHDRIKINLTTDFNELTMHLTNFYEFPYGKGIKSIS